MMRFISVASFIFFIFSSSAFTQKIKKADKVILANLETHIRFLADDKLEGRRAGTAGEKLASNYISTEFHNAGLEMIEEKTWLQPFDINDGKQIDDATHFSINNNELVLDKDYFP